MYIKNLLIVVQIAFCLFNGLRLMGNYFFVTGRFVEAVAVDPYNYIYHFGVGTALMRSNNTRKAEKHLRRTLELNPGYHNAMNNLGIVLVSQDRLEEAYRVLKKLYEIRPNHMAGEGNFKEVKKMLEKRK